MIRESRTTTQVRVPTLRMDITPTNEFVVRDEMSTKFSRKRRAPIGKISGKIKLGRERINEVELGADGKNDASIEESCKRVPAHCGALHLTQGQRQQPRPKQRNRRGNSSGTISLLPMTNLNRWI